MAVLSGESDNERKFRWGVSPWSCKGRFTYFSILVSPPYMQNFDDIWFTFKARIAAELRLKNNDVHSQVLLVWYAILSSCAGIVAIRYPSFAGDNTDLYTAILSVGLLAISILVSTRDYRGRAIQMRANHIALKRFHDELCANIVDPKKKPEIYAKLLGECENHSSYDDRYFRIINRVGLTSRIPNWTDWVLMLKVLFGRVGTLLGLYLSPPVILWCLNA